MKSIAPCNVLVYVNDEKLVNLMAAAGLTDQTLGILAGVGKSTIENFRRGNGPLPWRARKELVVAVAAALNVELSELIIKDSDVPEIRCVQIFGPDHTVNASTFTLNGAWQLSIASSDWLPKSFPSSFEIRILHRRHYFVGFDPSLVDKGQGLILNGEILRGSQLVGGMLFRESPLATLSLSLRGNCLSGSLAMLGSHQCVEMNAARIVARPGCESKQVLSQLAR